MITPSSIIRSNRRSLSLTIAKDGSLIVRAPKKLSMEYIYSFIKQKEKWIINKQQAIQNSKIANLNLINGEEYLCFGKVYSKVEISKLKEIEIADGNIFLPSDVDDYKKYVMLFKWYSKLTKEVVKNRIEYFSNLMQVNYSLIKIDNSKRRWGCYKFKIKA